MKHHFKFLSLLAVLLVPWAMRAQTSVTDVQLRTGVDASKWVTLSSSATSAISSTGDDVASSVNNIGMTVRFMGQEYTQFSVNTNGTFRLGSTATTSDYPNQFTSSKYTLNTPKILGISRDQSLGSTGYIKSEVVGTAPNRIFVCEYMISPTSSSTNTNDVNWQVQYHESDSTWLLIYGAAPTSTPSAFQIGLSLGAAGVITINPTTHTSSLGYTSTTYSAWPGQYRYYKFAKSTCPRISNLQYSLVSTDTAILSWTAGGSESSWVVSRTGWDTVVYSNSVTITNLTAASDYTFSVKAICSSTDTSDAVTTSFRTPCAAINLPYTQNFDAITTSTTAATGVAVPCWTVMHQDVATTTASYLPSVYYGSANAFSGNYCMRMYYRTAVALPPINLPSLKNVEMTFKYKAGNATSYRMEVGVMTSPGDWSSYVPLKYIVPSGTTYDSTTVSFEDAPDGARYIVIHNLGYSANYATFYIDDINVYAIDCAKPAHVAAAPASATSVKIDWDYDIDASYWIVNANGASQDVYNPTATITGLTPGSSYTFSVQTVNGYGDTSAPRMIPTTLVAAPVAPFVDNFDSYTSSTSTNTGVMPTGWRRHLYAYTTTSASDFPQIYYSTSYATSGSYSIRMYAQYLLVSPVFDLDSLNDMVMAVDVMQTRNVGDMLEVGTMTNPDDINSYLPLDTLNCASTASEATHFIVNLSNAQKGAKVVAFRNFSTTTSAYSTSFIDNFMIYPASCQPVANLQARSSGSDSIILNWRPLGTEYSWIVSYVDTMYDVTDTFLVLTMPEDLRYNTLYTFGVAPLCNGDTGVFADVTMRTPCGPISLPYFDNFDSYTTVTSSNTNVLPMCWRILSADVVQTANNQPQLYYTTTGSGVYTSSGNYCLRLYYRGKLVMPPLAVDSMKNVHMEFDLYQSGSTTYALEIGVMSDTTDASTYIPLHIIQCSNPSVQEHIDISFENAPDSARYIVFHNIIAPTSTSTVNYSYNYIDDLEIYEATCPKVTNLQAHRTVPTAATLTWDGERGTSYIVSDGTHTRALSTPRFTTDTLTAGTEYTYSVRKVCSVGDTSPARTITFVTPCTFMSASALPYSYGFEDATASGATGLINACWTKDKRGQGTNYPYPYSSYHATGSYCLYGYGSSNIIYSWVAMPGIDTNVNTLSVKFKLFKTAVSGGGIEVGVMTDPYDPSTFATQCFYYPNHINEWEEFEHSFADYADDGHFVAFMFRGTTTYLDDITLKVRAPEATCLPVRDIELVQAAPTSVAFRWPDFGMNDRFAIHVDSANVVLRRDTVNTSNYIATGLRSGTGYTLNVARLCDNVTPEWTSYSFATGQNSCLTINPSASFIDTVGSVTSTTTTPNLPSSSNYNYGYSEQLFLATELHPGLIKSIKLNATAVNARQLNYEIWLGHTTAANLASSFAPQNDRTLVYSSGPIPTTAGQWVEFVLDQPFEYNGIDNLVVTFCDITGPSYSSGWTWKTTAASPAKARYLLSNASRYVPGTVDLNLGTSMTVRNTMIFSFDVCLEHDTCAAPVAQVVSTSDTSIDLTWNMGGIESSWNVEHRVQGVSSWTRDLTATSLTSLHYGSLTENTVYEFRVSSTCRTDTLYTTVSAQTKCSPRPVPFYEDFSSWTVDAPCWNIISTNGYPSAASARNIEGTNSAYFYGPSSTRIALVLPKLEAPLDTLSVSFATLVYNTSGNQYPVVLGLLTDPNDFNTFTPIATIPTTTYEAWEYHAIDIPDGTMDGYLTFASPYGIGANYYLDAVKVEYKRPCARPRSITVDSTSATSIALHWNSPATNFEVEYGQYGFELGTGSTITANATHAELTGLEPGRNYTIYVRAICGAGDTSLTSAPITTNTQCQDIMSLPYAENFDSWGTGNNVHAPNCWAYGSSFSTSYPYIRASTMPGGFLEMYGTNTTNTWAMMPAVDPSLGAMNNLQVHLSVFGFNGGTADALTYRVVVGVSDVFGDISTFTPCDTVYGGWLQFIESDASLASYTGTGRYITFVSSNDTTVSNIVAIDEIVVERIPTCPRPDNLSYSLPTTNSVSLVWTDHAGASRFQVEYGPHGFTLGTGTRVTATDTFYTLTGLQPSYDGDFYVRAICGGTDTGDFSRQCCRFYTRQTPATIPYHYDYEAAAEWNNWQTNVNFNDEIGWVRGTAVANDGNYSMYVSPNALAANPPYLPYYNNRIVNATAFRDIDFGSVDSSFTIVVKGRAGGTIEAIYDALYIFLADPSLPTITNNNNMTTPWGPVRDMYNFARIRLDTTWNVYKGEFDTISGVKRVGFFWYNQNTVASYPAIYEAAAIDSVVVDYSPCPRPIFVNQIASTSSSITLGWHGAATVDYQICYRKLGESASNNVYVPVSGANQATLFGLDMLTDYSIWVRKICGSDTSLWSDRVVMSTVACPTAAYAETNPDSLSLATTPYFPSYSGSASTYSEVVLTPSQLSNITTGEIKGLSFIPTVLPENNQYDNVTIYLANVADSVSDVSAHFNNNVDTNFEQVFHGSLRLPTANQWYTVVFDTSFMWDGQSNLLVAIHKLNTTSTPTAGATFKAYNDTVTRARYLTSSSLLTVGNITGGSPSTVIPVYRLVSCDDRCPVPTPVPATNVDYQGATLSWISDGQNFEVEYKTNAAASWDSSALVSVTSLTLSGLQPATLYQYRVRQICDSINGEANNSEWVMGSFLTDSLPCFAPTALHLTDSSLTTASFAWTIGTNETSWNIHVWNAGFDSVYLVNANPSTVSGLVQSTQYFAAVAARCGGGLVVSDYSDTISFSTAACTPVSNIVISDTTTNGAVVTWNGSAQSYTIEYGERGFPQGAGSSVTVTDTRYEITGLDDETMYDVLIRANCDAENSSVWSERNTFTTKKLGINSASNVDVTIYPNPAHQSATISLKGVAGDVVVEVIDLNGRTVHSESLLCDGSCIASVEVSNMAAGTYFVRINGQGINTVRKLIVK